MNPIIENTKIISHQLRSFSFSFGSLEANIKLIKLEIHFCIELIFKDNKSKKDIMVSRPFCND